MKRLLYVIFICVIFPLSLVWTVDAVSAETGDIQLTEHPKGVNVDLITALEQRKSTRQYALHPVSPETLSVILWAANGVNRPDGKRTAPSAYGKQYIDIYVATPQGFYLYDAQASNLKFKGNTDIRKRLSKQQHVMKAPYVLILVANMDITFTRSF